jgi:hypothetical protein
MTSIVTFTAEALAIRPWLDEGAEPIGYDPRSPYVERFWLGIIGPSTTWLMRRLAAGFDVAPEGFALPVTDTARAIGLGDKAGRHSPFLRTVNRMIQFELARVAGPDLLEVRRQLPPLNRRLAARLSPALQEEHERWLTRQLEAPPPEVQARRGRRLALSLFELGEEAEEVERQLLRWRYHPAVAREAAEWAADRHRSAHAAAPAV